MHIKSNTYLSRCVYFLVSKQVQRFSLRRHTVNTRHSYYVPLQNVFQFKVKPVNNGNTRVHANFLLIFLVSLYVSKYNFRHVSVSVRLSSWKLFQPVTVVSKLVQQVYTRGETIHEKYKNTEHTK